MHPALLLVSVLSLPASSPPVPATPVSFENLLEPRDDAEDAWRFIAGLAERDLHDQVVREAKSFLQDHGGHDRAPDVRYRLADALFELDRLDEARPHFERLAGRDGFSLGGEARFRLGQCELERGELQAAAAALQVVSQAGPDYLKDPATFLWGEALFRAQDFAQARERFAAVDAKGERAADALHGQAWCAFRLDDTEGVIALVGRFDQRFAGDARRGELAYLVGEAHLAAGRPGPARQAFAKVPDGPHKLAALRGAAFAAADEGDRRAAIQGFTAVLEQDPKGPHAREAALHRGIHVLELDGAEAALDAWKQHDPGDDAEALYWFARAELGAGNLDQAERHLKRALSLNGSTDELRARLQQVRGDVVAANGNLLEAAQAWRASGTDWGLQAAAAALLTAGDHEGAIQVARELLDREEGEFHDEAALVLGEAQFATQDWKQAAETFVAIAKSDPDAPDRARATLRLGWCAFMTGDAASARTYFVDAAKNRGEHEGRSEARFMAARCAEELGDGQAARTEFADYLAKDAEGEHAAEAGLRGGRLIPGEAGEQRLAWVRSTYPDSPFAPRAVFELAERLSARQQVDAAIARYEELLEAYPNDVLAPHASYGLGWILWSSGQAGPAATALWRTVDGSDETLVTAALELLVWAERKNGNASQARKACLAFAARTNDHGRRMGTAKEASLALIENGEPGEALGLWVELRGSSGSHAESAAIDVERAHLILAAGRLDDCQTILDRLRRADEDVAGLGEAYLFLGEARFEAGDTKGATHAYDLAILEGGAPEVLQRALYKGGFAWLRLDDADKAVARFAALVEQHPACTFVGESLFLMGEAHFRAGRFAEAESALRRVVENHKRHDVRPKALFRLGIACGEQGKWAESAPVLNELLQRHSDFEAALEAELWRGRALMHTDKSRAARAAFERVAKGDAGILSARARIGLGQLAEAANEAEDALAEYLKVAVLYAHAEEVAEALYRAGDVLAGLGQDDKAAARFEEASQKHPDTVFGRRAKSRLGQGGGLVPPNQR